MRAILVAGIPHSGGAFTCPGPDPGAAGPAGSDQSPATVVPKRHGRDMTTRRAPRRTRRAALLLAGLALAVTGCSASGDDGSTAMGGSGSVAGPSAAAPPAGPRYVALGDSFTSAPFVPVTDVADGCLRSSSNYPALVAEALDADLDDRSCGGATTAHFERSQFPEVPPQLEALGPETELVTVGIGGNDNLVYRRLTNQCPALRARDPQGSPCRDFMQAKGGDVLLDALDRTRVQVTTLVRKVQRRAPEAKVLVVGYPQIVSARNVCEKLPLARGDYAYAVKVNRALTDALRSAARATGSTYVDVWTASRGHDICSDDPWVNGSVTDQKRALNYHPFAEEQQAVAELVVDAARD